MRWREVYEVWRDINYFTGDDMWVVLCRKSAQRKQIYGYPTKKEAEDGAKELFEELQLEIEKVVL